MERLCSCGCGRPTLIARFDYKRTGVKKGESNRTLKGHRPHKPQKSYWVKYDYTTKRQFLMHRMRAEKALGKPLPPKAIVHHADGSRADDAPLVICQNQAYHRFLHHRMRVKAAGGNPNTDACCGHCKQAKPRSEFYPSKIEALGVVHHCIACDKVKQALIRERRRQSKAGAA